ncbi:PREDICTED: craniofacial development protein 2-like [Nicotiana attenuata]|uniref:craniofacial development protein 2-like n=1 Tax=Nicotiana attenuata TaxID=49451 RepID=UPI000904FA66|nr:PREDICTED: craniofacial development protein 2-like [Nicotiana attenuata]
MQVKAQARVISNQGTKLDQRARDPKTEQERDRARSRTSKIERKLPSQITKSRNIRNRPRITAKISETRWVDSKARDANGFKLWVSGCERGKNGVGILVDRDLRELVVEVRRVNDRLMAIKLAMGGSTLNVISAYAPQVGLDEEIKRRFWEEFDGLVCGILLTEKLFIGGNFNGHIGTTFGGYDSVHGGFGFGVRNERGIALLDCAKAFDLVIANSCFPKREEHLATFQSSLDKTKIDYLLLRKCDRSLCMDCKVIHIENLTTQHRLLVMDLKIVRKRRKRVVYGQPKIRWCTLTSDKA